MNYYEVSVKFNRKEGVFWSTDETLPFPDSKEDNEKRFYKNFCKEINEHFDMETDVRTDVYAYYANEGIVKFIFEADINEAHQGVVEKAIRTAFKDKYDQVEISTSKAKEITCESYYKLGKNAEKNDYIDDFDDEEIDVFRNDCHPYKIKEELISEKKYDLDELLLQAKETLVDETFIDEINRIYSTDNEKKYYGNPVHYLFTVTNRDSVGNMINLLGRALLVNKRLVGRRITKIGELEEHCYNEDEFEQTIARSAGNIVLLEMDGTYEDHGNYANSFHMVMEYINKLFKKYQRNTLFVFVKNLDHPGFADPLMEMIVENAQIIEIKEGGGSTEQAMEYIKRLACKDGQPVNEDELRKILSNRKFVKVGEAHELYNKCFSNALMYKVYKAYQSCPRVKIAEKKQLVAPYEELQKMIGLSEIKKVIDFIINNAKIQKIRSDKGIDNLGTSLHMVYTGNPGSAKTTVARLLAQILAKERIIDRADIVECGRADLVGKYVGWTAKTVKAKFKEAMGGVLFIDEAYSLVEHWEGSYGDEAINTIVQEMENHREDVIVIFAGYPEKMKDFLDRNEGLRSRISFHLDFPDYKSDELVQILKLMADQRGLILAPGVTDKCKEIFDDAVKQKDFGNGRFARNILEQAVMSQADRLAKEYKGKKISRTTLVRLKSEDFNATSYKHSDNKMKIGFA